LSHIKSYQYADRTEQRPVFTELLKRGLRWIKPPEFPLEP